MRTIIDHGTIVNEGKTFRGSLVLDNDHIESVIVGETAPRGSYDHHVDATGCLVLPGIIDEHVHFREPGLTDKADIKSESRAAAWGGVTTYFDMPNTKPATTSEETWSAKMALAKNKSHVNYAFFYGATNNNADTFKTLDATQIPGIKLFMGASTGNMLVDRREALEKIFAECARLGVPLMTHCEDTNIINHNMAAAKAKYGEDPDIRLHPLIRSEEACYNSSSLAVQLAKAYGTRLHIAHISTAKELGLLPANDNAFCKGSFPKITGEAVLAHLLFTNNDYATRKALIKCNPSVKTTTDREALRLALSDGNITCIGTDHAPHKLSDKQGGCAKAASGMPMLQFSLVSMLRLVDEGVLSVEQLVWLMCHNPARLFAVKARGFIRPGYKADLTIVQRGAPWTLTESLIQSKCKWSPLTGEQFRWKVIKTICNGHTIFDEGKMDEDYRGEAVKFEHPTT